MNLEDIFDALRYGELSQLSIGGEDQGVINEKNWKPVVSSVQLGLTALYRRFNLLRNIAYLYPVEGKYTYQMRRDNFRNAPNFDPVRNPFAHGPGDKFQDNLIDIEAIYAANGDMFTLNQNGNDTSIICENNRTIILPKVFFDKEFREKYEIKDGEPLTIHYRGDHPKLFNRAELDSAYYYNVSYNERQIDLPDIYTEALLYFVAARFHNPIGMQNEFHSGNSYAQKYEMICAQLEQTNIQNDTMLERSTFRSRGFV